MRCRRYIAKNQDVGLVALIVAVISLMIFPLPFPVLDALIAFNISISLVLLMLTIYVPEALAMSTFPSLLLFTTLLRLGLNIASVKLILLHARAGEVIETFGRLVVGGNYVVGGVVFLIITIVQFVVIAKGSERVAEVGARFTLDAMPGKQMSIDADLRNNLLTADEARKKRRRLELESQMHGGMDGAMKFVKGDAIAGLIISMVNIVAGICVGSVMRNMSIGDAAARYAILTVGDGMVSQLPSLFISIAAGVLITRVSGADQAHSNLGADIGTQLFAQPKALIITAIILFMCALLPGFPKIQFGVLALGLGIAGRTMLKRSKDDDADANKFEMTAFAREGAKDDPLDMFAQQAAVTSAPLLVRSSRALGERLRPAVLNDAVNEARTKVQEDLGIPFPGMRLLIAEELVGMSYEVLIYDVPHGKVTWPEDACAVLADRKQLTLAGIDTQADLPKPFAHICWVKTDDTPRLHEAGLALCSMEQFLAAHIASILRGNAKLFTGMQEVKAIIARAEPECPDVAQEAVKAMTLQRMTEVFGRLLEEEIPVRNVRGILEAVANWAPRERDTVMLTEQVRIGLGRYITYKYSHGESSLDIVLLSHRDEQLIRQTVQQGGGGSYLPVSPERAQQLADQTGELLGKSERGAVMVTHMDVRRYVKKMLEPYLPELVVLSFEELNASIRLNPLGEVGL
ncbi:hypothetical protein WJ62_12020 [Burkholderia diffusa]|nr:hypothetical protein WJ62_12020 [Burkholderia diffusa]